MCGVRGFASGDFLEVDKMPEANYTLTPTVFIRNVISRIILDSAVSRKDETLSLSNGGKRVRNGVLTLPCY